MSEIFEKGSITSKERLTAESKYFDLWHHVRALQWMLIQEGLSRNNQAVPEDYTALDVLHALTTWKQDRRTSSYVYKPKESDLSILLSQLYQVGKGNLDTIEEISKGTLVREQLTRDTRGYFFSEREFAPLEEQEEEKPEEIHSLFDKLQSADEREWSRIQEYLVYVEKALGFLTEKIKVVCTHYPEFESELAVLIEKSKNPELKHDDTTL